MFPRSSIKKAKITDLDTNSSFTFPFNPEAIEITRGCSFGEGDGNTDDHWAGLKAEGGKVDSITLSFILDTTEPDIYDSRTMLNMMSPVIIIGRSPAKNAMPPVPVNKDDVQDTINKLYRLTMMLDPKDKDNLKNRPHIVEFAWENIRFAGGITDFQFKFTLFDSDATPKRAEVTMGMKGRYLVDGDGSMPKDGHVNLLVPKTISSTATSKKKL